MPCAVVDLDEFGESVSLRVLGTTEVSGKEVQFEVFSSALR